MAENLDRNYININIKIYIFSESQAAIKAFSNHWSETAINASCNWSNIIEFS
jgi:hypothetical protein